MLIIIIIIILRVKLTLGLGNMCTEFELCVITRADGIAAGEKRSSVFVDLCVCVCKNTQFDR